ncbi:AAA family ATPase [Acuticoccus sp. I52.16.1]|uniref:nSTAND1 domain-containing NTPase n=1 Tax=Acuticoccus sp. I52.16.1 TaxID=2928472 RepID=UPI001FD339B4|nr:AAA family ATPase [Acuticoccus sp. I52.16.1]UOM36709.1 hypothetical protein MRB58_11170 [Acuticoccus sp. I52.16.1]
MTSDVRIFVSSPSDVPAERIAVERVATRVAAQFEGLEIKVTRWESGRYYSAHTGFQEQIEEIGRFHLVVGILWSRLGTPLPPGFGPGMPPPREGQPYPSGTAFEILEAIRLRNERDAPPPEILVYRKLAPTPSAKADDDMAQEELLAQRRAVNGFFRDFFANETEGFKGAFQTFEDLDRFESRFEADLIAWLRDAGGLGRQRRWRIEDPERGCPFVGLNAFGPKHRDVFFGRRADIERARERLEAGNGFLMIDGASGTGKSSLVRAGLLPRLRDLNPDLRVAITVPETADPLTALAQALFDKDALPELARSDYPDSVALARHFAGGGDASPVLRALDRAAKALIQAERRDSPTDLRLVVVVDQLEALFTNRVPTEMRTVYANLLAEFVASGCIRLVATLRANAREAALLLPALGQLVNGQMGLSLEPPGPDAVAEIIRGPAEAAALDFERNGEGVGLDEVLLREVEKDPDALPLLQFALEKLYESAARRVVNGGARLGDIPESSPVLTLTHGDYHALGGLSGAIGHQAETALKELPDAVQSRLAPLVRSLTEAGSGAFVLARVPAAQAAPDPETRELAEALIAARIIVQGSDRDGDSGGAVTTLRFSHERVLTAWDRARVAVQAAAGFLRVRADLIRAEARWRQAGRKPDLLLPSGIRLAEAEEAFRDFGPELDRQAPRLRDYVQNSGRRARRRQRLTQVAAVVLAALTVTAVSLAYRSYQDSMRAEKAQIQAETERDRAELSQGLADESRRRAMALLAQLLAEDDPQSSLRLAVVNWPVSEQPTKEFQALALQAISIALKGTLPQNVISGPWGLSSVDDLSPDRSMVLSSDFDGNVTLWGVATKSEVLKFSEHTDYSLARAFSYDGRHVYTGADDGSVFAWVASTGEKIAEFPGNEDRVWQVEINPTGSMLATAGQDRTVRIWNTDTGEIRAVLRGHSEYVRSVGFSPDSQHLVSGSGDDSAIVWDLSSESPKFILLGHEGEVRSAEFSPDGTLIATASGDHTVRIWDASSGETGTILKGHDDGVNSVAFSPNGLALASASSDGTIRIWDVRTGSEIRKLLGHDGEVRTVKFTPDGNEILSSSFDRTIRIWNVQGSYPASEVRDVGWSDSVTFSPDGRLIVPSKYHSPEIIDIENGQIMGRIDTVTPGGIGGPLIHSVVFSPDGRRIFTASGGQVRVWSSTGDPQGVLWENERTIVRQVAVDPDGSRVAIGSDDRLVRLLNSRTGAEILQLAGHESFVYGVAFSFDGTKVASASGDNTVRIWDSSTGTELAVLEGHEKRVLSVSFSPDGKYVVSTSSDNSVRVWSVDSREQLMVLNGHTSEVRRAVFHPGGERILSGSADGTARIWDLQTGAELLSMKTVDTVDDVAVSADGSRFAIVGQFKSVNGPARPGSAGLLRIWKWRDITGAAPQVACGYIRPDGGVMDASVSTTLEGLSPPSVEVMANCEQFAPMIFRN